MPIRPPKATRGHHGRKSEECQALTVLEGVQLILLSARCRTTGLWRHADATVPAVANTWQPSPRDSALISPRGSCRLPITYSPISPRSSSNFGESWKSHLETSSRPPHVKLPSSCCALIMNGPVIFSSFTRLQNACRGLFRRSGPLFRHIIERNVIP